MAQKKAHEVEGWLARPDPATSIVLIYGLDRGLVSEQATRYAVATGLPLDDPFTVTKLDAGTLERESGRLLDEINAIAMFASKRLIWVRGASADKKFAEEVKQVAAGPAADTIVLIEAGDLKKGAALRTAVETAPRAMALPCYADAERDLDRIIEEELEKAGLTIDRDARLLLRASLGGDRLATRSELAKLALYATGQRSISTDDVRAAVSDVAQDSIDDVVDAVLAGNAADLDVSLARALSAPNATYPILSAMARQLLQMHVLCKEVEAGRKSASAAVAGARPPVIYKRRAVLEKALSSWSTARVENAIARVHSVTLQTRRRADLSSPLIRQMLLGMALGGTRRTRQG